MIDNFYKRALKKIFYLWIFSSFFWCDKRSNEDYFARVNGDKVTIGEFSRRLEYFTRVTGIKDNLQTREDLLDQMINEKLLIQEFNRLKMDDSPEFKRKANSIRDQFFLDELRKRAFFDTITVNEAEIKRLFDFYNQKVSARHLFARTKDEADKLFQELQKGASFGELASYVFQDSSLAANGGYLGYFGKDEMDPAFEKVAFSLPVGEISQPVQTDFGYSIIKVEDRIHIPIVSESDYRKSRPVLINEIKRNKIDKYAQEHGNQLANQLNPEFDQSVIDFLYSELFLPENEANFVVERELVIPEKLFETVKNDRVVNFDGGNWTVEIFLKHAKSTSRRQQQRIKNLDDLKKFILGLLVRQELIKQAERLDVGKDKKVHQEIEHAIDGYIVTHMVKTITDSSTVPTEALQEIYNENPGDYVFPAEANIQEILVATKQQAYELMERIRNGEDFSEIAQTHSIREWAKNRGGKLGFAPKDKYGALGDTIFAMQAGETIGPVEIEGYYSIIKLIKKRAERQKSFAEAREQIEREQLWKWRKIHLHNYLGGLRSRADVRVSRDKLRLHVFNLD